MAFKLGLSKKADEDLIAILDYYQELSKTVAAKIWEQILKAFTLIEENPQIGRVVPEFRDEGNNRYREMIVDNYRIIYMPNFDVSQIVVVRIVDSRQLLQMDVE